MNRQSGETWLCDLGNSRAKLARLAGGAPVDVVALDWTLPDFDARLRQGVAAWPRPERVLVASVASAGNVERLRGLLSVEPEILRTPRAACGLRNRYAKPERLGIDRFLSMLAVHTRAGGAGIVVGCGTALTLDAVAGDGDHAAGLIALSPERMLEALRGATSIADRNPDAFAGTGHDDTALALQAGCWATAGAAVEWFAQRQRATLGEARVWLHGGWAPALAAWLARDGFSAELFEHAVLHGLAACATVESPDREW